MYVSRHYSRLPPKKAGFGTAAVALLNSLRLFRMNCPTPPLRLVLIDRDPLALLGLRTLVEKQFPSLTVCAEFHSVAEAEAQAEQYRPDVIVLDIEMNGGAAFTLPRRWRSAEDGPPCLARLENESPAVLGAALRAGARGVVYRREPSESFLVALTHVACGLPHLSNVAGPLLAAGVAKNTLDQGDNELHGLSPRERQIFQMLSQGQTNRDDAGLQRQDGPDALRSHQAEAALG